MRIIILTFTFLCLFIAAGKDIKDRTIPDIIPGMILLSGFLLPGGPRFLGLLVALPLLWVGCTKGGIGGGDVKLVGAIGVVLGFWTTLYGLIISLCCLIAGHLFYSIFHKENKGAYPMVPFLFGGMLMSCLVL